MSVTDVETFESHGLRVTIKHNALGLSLGMRGSGYLGYVDIPKDHPWYGLDEDEVPASVHGDVTYSAAEGDGWRIGFDCLHAHSGSMTLDAVREECVALAGQARRAA